MNDSAIWEDHWVNIHISNPSPEDSNSYTRPLLQRFHRPVYFLKYFAALFPTKMEALWVYKNFCVNKKKKIYTSLKGQKTQFFADFVLRPKFKFVPK